MNNSLLSLKYERATNSLEVLDQLEVPHRRVMIAVPDCEAAWAVIREMKVLSKTIGAHMFYLRPS